MAAPHVSGGLALLADYFRGQLGNTELVQRLFTTANKEGIYSNSEILVLDEATSAVDLQTEEKIIKNINSLSKKTIIIISHRMSTIKDCNKIFEIKNNNLRQIK
mgnify:CR=1 FL=1